MLTIEIKVNGNLVAAITAANHSFHFEKICEYRAAGFLFPFGDVGALNWETRVKHERTKGILSLAALLLKDAVGAQGQ